MDLPALQLNMLPHELDMLAFWALALIIGLGGAWAIKGLSDAMARTDRAAARFVEAQATGHAQEPKPERELQPTAQPQPQPLAEPHPPGRIAA